MFWVPEDRLEGGKYIVQKVLGQGGFGTTYLARDTYLERSVVLKTLKKKITHNPNLPKFEEKFTNEAKILANLTKFRHPHIVQIYDCFKEHQLLYLVMEYIEGENLYKIVTKEGALGERKALEYIQQIGSALIAIHEQNFLHLDVNPNNIILRTEIAEVVLIDFGNVLNFKNASTTELSPTSQGYSPFEQYSTKLKRGTYSDVYSLAATLYFLLTSITPISSIDRFLGQELNFPHNLNINDSIKYAILAGMSLEAEDRPQSVQDWLNLLPTTSSRNNKVNDIKNIEEFIENFVNNFTVVNDKKQLKSVIEQEATGFMVFLVTDKATAKCCEIILTHPISSIKKILASLGPLMFSPPAATIGLTKDLIYPFVSLVNNLGIPNVSLLREQYKFRRIPGTDYIYLYKKNSW
jgi:serine/threonine protein kinase